MARMRRWLTEALAEYRRHPRWAAAGLSVIALALAAASLTWITRQLAPPPADAPAGITSSAPAVPHPPASHRTSPRPGPAASRPASVPAPIASATPGSVAPPDAGTLISAGFPALLERALQLRPGAPGQLAGHAAGLARFRAARLSAALSPGPGQPARFAGAD